MKVGRSLRDISLCLLLAGSLASIAAHSEPPPLEAYAAPPAVSLMTLSPSGKRVAYRMTAGDRDQVEVLDLATREILGSVGVDTYLPENLLLVNDEDLIAATRSSEQIYGKRGPFYAGAAFLYRTSAGELRQLLRDRDVTIQSGMGQVVGVIGDGKRVLMPAFHSPASSY